MYRKPAKNQPSTPTDNKKQMTETLLRYLKPILSTFLCYFYLYAED